MYQPLTMRRYLSIPGPTRLNPALLIQVGQIEHIMGLEVADRTICFPHRVTRDLPSEACQVRWLFPNWYISQLIRPSRAR